MEAKGTHVTGTFLPMNAVLMPALNQWMIASVV
jgi:hypothetical protein